MKNKNFIIIGQIISLFGNAIQRFSMSLYLLAFTGSTSTFATILSLSTIPYIIFAPIAGRLSDKINKKKIMVYLDLFCFALIGVYAFILFKGNDNVLIVGTVMFILSICATLYGPAVTSSIPQIVEEEKLTSANGVINQVGSIVNFVGPILAGILYGLLGIKIIVIINAVSFLISAIMEMFLNIPDVEIENIDIKNEVAVTKDNEKIMSLDFIKNSFMGSKDVFIYLKREKKIVLGIIVSYALCNIFLSPILTIVAPYFVNIFLGFSSEVYGIVEGVLGFINLNNYALAIIFALGGFAIMLSLALSNVLTLTFIQKQVPGEMLGSVSAFSTAVATISVAPGQLLFGQVIDLGVPIGIILSVSAILNIGLMLFVKWNVRNLKTI